MAQPEVEDELAASEQTDDSAAIEIAEQAEHFLMVFRDAEKAAEKLAEWVRENYPERIATAYWITITEQRDHDKGIAIQIARLPWTLQLKALLGRWSAGFGVFTRPYDVQQFKAKVSVGAGAVAPYDDLGKLMPVLGIAVKF